MGAQHPPSAVGQLPQRVDPGVGGVLELVQMPLGAVEEHRQELVGGVVAHEAQRRVLPVVDLGGVLLGDGSVVLL